jgi:CheY-like chemotaxis protein
MQKIPTGLQGAHVMLVEDNEINQMIATELLALAGVTLEIVENGRKAVKRILYDTASYDVILMGLLMPEMDGLSATRLIRKQIGANQLPIIALTSNSMEEERERCLSAGMNDLVCKPIQPYLLYETLDRWVNSHVTFCPTPG